ncbi:MAG: tRNA threonylcarbamoyladenosine dehydratase [Alphaproteobacteria bacterium]|nr:tRNA threonylcarbamoyladenosine dehydratase [Alphaproteobacteria bacterium]
MHPFHRTELLVGKKGFARLQRSSVLIVGLGGVGSFAAEAIARSGVGRIGLCDFDEVCVTNLNRQLHAFRRTVGMPKADLMQKRVSAINPKAEVIAFNAFYNADSSEEILGPGWDWVIDCIDNVSAKLHLLETCVRRGIPVVSAMGAGSKLDPTRVKVSDLAHTRNDPLAKVIRKQLRRRGVDEGVIAVWSDEPTVELDADVSAAFRCICPTRGNDFHNCDDRHVIQGTASFLPGMFGLAAAGAVVNGILERDLLSARQHRRLAGEKRSASAGSISPSVDA